LKDINSIINPVKAKFFMINGFGYFTEFIIII
ncbi:MAG: hypothetical protein ACI8ZO_001180, partial [Flavobacteriales bacterium]